MPKTFTYKKKFLILFTLFYLLIPWMAFAKKTVIGVVADKTNAVLPGVTVPYQKS